MNFDFIRFTISLDCKLDPWSNDEMHCWCYRTPPPPVVGDPLRVRLFPGDSDEDINDDHMYLYVSSLFSNHIFWFSFSLVESLQFNSNSTVVEPKINNIKERIFLQCSFSQFLSTWIAYVSYSFSNDDCDYLLKKKIVRSKEMSDIRICFDYLLAQMNFKPRWSFFL